MRQKEKINDKFSPEKTFKKEIKFMTYLTLAGAIRSESEPQVINNLKRKGWIETVQPSFDPATQNCEWVNGQWVITQRDIRIEQFNAAIETGYLVSPENFTLALGDTDRAQFAQFLALIREALDLNLINGDTIQSIKDAPGNLHYVSTNRLRQILVNYGFYYKTLWDNLNS